MLHDMFKRSKVTYYLSKTVCFKLLYFKATMLFLGKKKNPNIIQFL